MRAAEGRDKLVDAGGSSGDKDDFASDVLAKGGAEGKEEEDGDGDERRLQFENMWIRSTACPR